MANASDAGETLYVGKINVPVSDTVWDVAGPATFTFSNPVFVSVPHEVGRNVTLTVQLAPAARGVLLSGQLFV